MSSTLTGLPAAAAVAGADLLYGVQGGASVKMTAAQLAAFAGGAAGFTPLIAPYGVSPLAAQTSNPTLAANGGSIAIPFVLPAPISLQGITFRNADAASARSIEWALYRDLNTSGTLNAITGAAGVWIATPSAAGTRVSPCNSPPIAIAPGVVWMVFRCTHATNGFIFGGNANASGVTDEFFAYQTKGGVGALGSTIDMVTGWTKVSDPIIPVIFLSGRVFGVAAGWGG